MASVLNMRTTRSVKRSTYLTLTRIDPGGILRNVVLFISAAVWNPKMSSEAHGRVETLKQALKIDEESLLFPLSREPAHLATRSNRDLFASASFRATFRRMAQRKDERIYAS